MKTLVAKHQAKAIKSLFLTAIALILMLTSTAGETYRQPVADKAKKQSVAAPFIPPGELNAQQIKLPSGDHYAVYSGPSHEYLRGANGKASVSTNEWIQVFGKENGWILIQYAIAEDHMRFGWIPEKALSKSASIQALTFSPYAVTLAETAAITDDPLFSQIALLTLPKGAIVYHLADMGDWAYIESASGDFVRGFIHRDKLLSGTVYDLADIPNSNGFAILRGHITIDQGHLKIEVEPDMYEIQPSAPIYGIRIYDNITNEPFFTTFEKGDSGYIIGNCDLPRETTSLRIVVLNEDGAESNSSDAPVLEW